MTGVETTVERDTEAVRHLREAAAARVENTSLRAVAREIGMSPTGLTKFLRGTVPYSPTLRRLRKWYLQFGAPNPPSVGIDEASAALAILTHDLLPGARRAATNAVLEVMGAGYDRSGKPRPRWIADLRLGIPTNPGDDTLAP
jgi:transcriptional regulator with XRE-family HTH domain